MSTHQEYWDACIIKTWRQHGSFLDAVTMYKSITGIDLMTEENRRHVLRTPKHYFPAHTGIRLFVAQYLPKISDRLFSQAPEKDIQLLRKLSTSTYDVENKPYTNALDNEHKNLSNKLKRNRLRIGLNTLAKNNRNHDTDWNVVKGSRRKTA